MPVYTCTTTTWTLTTDVKTALAQEITRIHAEINHVPSTYVNVVFHELPADGIYTDGVPANPVLIKQLGAIWSPGRRNNLSSKGYRSRRVQDRQD
jgi:phenylpyruvate tautomerase PptA (4-oxalocrotonate tautomerase family)